ncbi:uncharacterized protein LOC118193393 isoform X1 [Stegodyphus dumicola]|uniref:uncharacterized protein LOC118193393 isoform X1 n=1 Tax=Stegodyphus dumicola TaxID=202533 RepID=UPI0015ADC659|nr:uncharacterized protein LOC118193393 isoform X1 [Stegodyphus dumicola]
MPLVGDCCFIFPLKDATVITGFICVGVALVGEVAAICSTLNYYTWADPLIQSLMRVSYFMDIPGIVFHAIFLVVSIILILGVTKDISALLIPWLGWCPLMLAAIFIEIVLVIIKDPYFAAPVICFCLMIFLFMIYGSLIVVSYFREMTKFDPHLRYLTDVSSEIPSSSQPVRRPRWIAFYKFRKPGNIPAPSLDHQMPGPSTADKSTLTDFPISEKSTMQKVLKQAYAKLWTTAHKSPQSSSSRNILSSSTETETTFIETLSSE